MKNTHFMIFACVVLLICGGLGLLSQINKKAETTPKQEDEYFPISIQATPGYPVDVFGEGSAIIEDRTHSNGHKWMLLTIGGEEYVYITGKAVSIPK